MEGNVTVKEIMAREYVGVSESDTVLGAVELMLDEGVDSVVVLRGSEPVGTLTCRDALTLVREEEDPAETPVREAMSDPTPAVPADSSLGEAAGTMTAEDSGTLLVTNAGELVGVLGERDIVTAAASLAPAAVQQTRSEATMVAAEPNAVAETESDGSYSTQSICEACGTLTRDLQNFNGQLLCTDCREV